MIIGIVTTRDNAFMEISEKIRERMVRVSEPLLLDEEYSREKGKENVDVDFVLLKDVSSFQENIILYSLHAVIFDMEFVESLSKPLWQQVLRVCRRQRVSYIIGAPEYPDQAVSEMARILRIEFQRENKTDVLQRIWEPPSSVISSPPQKSVLDSTGEIRRPEGTPIRAGVIGCGVGSGASFIASSVAKELTRRTGRRRPSVTVIGVEDTYFFDALGMEKRFRDRDFFDFFAATKQKKLIRGEENIDERINWIVRTPISEDDSLSRDEAVRLLYRSGGTIVLWDFSGGSQEDYKMDMLREMDWVIFVIDPLPSKLLENHRMISLVRQLECPMIMVINKWNKEVNKREVLRFLQIKNPIFIPLIEGRLFYEAEYRCKILYSMPEAESVLQSGIQQITDLLLSSG